MKWLIVLVALLVGIAIGIWYQKEHTPPPTHPPIRVMVGFPTKHAMVNPQPGDVIQWVDSKGTPMPMTQDMWDPFPSPCNPSVLTECHVLDNANHQVFAYECPKSWNCDPDVPVGSDVMTALSVGGLITAAVPSEVRIGCDPKTQKLVAKPVEAPVSAGLQGAVVWQWIGKAATWSVRVDLVKVCQETTIDQDHPTCTLTANLAPSIYAYTVMSSACTAPSTGLKLNVSK